MKRARYHPREPQSRLRSVLPERDHEALLAVHYNHCVRSSYLRAITGWGDIYGKERIRLLKQHRLIKAVQWVRDPYLEDLLFLDKKGREYLLDKGLYIHDVKSLKANTREQMPHTIMISDIIVSIQIECKKRGITFINEHEILDLTAPDPRLIPSTPNCVPDRYFGLRYGENVIIFAIEAETGSNRGMKRLKKIQTAQAMYKQRSWLKVPTAKGKSLPNLMTLFVTRDEETMRRYMEVVDEDGITEPLLFNWVPTIATEDDPPKADGRLLNEPWHTIDGLFSLATGKKQ